MRQSPTKVVFNYPRHKQDTPLYSPQLIHSGYIVGQPVAYTDHPNLPKNYLSFSPKPRQRANTSFPLNQSMRDHENNEFRYEAPDPAQFAPPLRQSFRGNASRRTDGVSMEEYNSLRHKYTELQNKYRILQQKYQRAITTKEVEPNEKLADWISRLVQLYKQNTLKESQLLIDRFRLESKEVQLDQRLRK